jgi:prepilin-type N-terminal cleavage/methylation domain-containing protein
LKKRNGFSLIEMVIAMAILAILSTIAVFSWQRYVINANLRTATRELEADIFLIKERAVSERIYYRITLNVGANNYTIDQGGAAAGDAYAVLQTKSPETLGSGNILLDTTFAGAQIIFQPRGTLGAGTGSVRLRNSRNSIATITISITGRTHVQFAMQ